MPKCLALIAAARVGGVALGACGSSATDSGAALRVGRPGGGERVDRVRRGVADRDLRRTREAVRGRPPRAAR